MEGKLFYRIREVAEILGVKPYVLRFWETEFPMIRPMKSPSGHRVYQPADVELLKQIKTLLYVERYSIEGARKRIRELKRLKGKALDPSDPRIQNSPSIDIAESMRELGELIRKPLSQLFELAPSSGHSSNDPRC
jgi:DNA-binding transcriptional MerR regulator